ncbi:MAG: hypothetical protein LAP87_04735 [Acidobacteriia bacterium]|nr:hypothetical protein [Terriglobia bacterium]
MFAQTAGVPVGFTTGQAARLVIGQTTFTSADSNSSDTIVGGVSGLAYAADTLFVADANRVGANPSNHRVLLFQNLSTMLPGADAELIDNRKCPVCLGQATLVLGQPDFTTTTEPIPATRSDMRQPTSVASDGIHVVVADTNHNRVLIWNRIPTTNDAPADVVVGQPDFTSVSVPGNTPNAKSMRGPQGVWILNGKLYVADTQNNRVLIYNSIPTANGAAADVVLGQPNFTTFVEPDLTQQRNGALANNMLNPVSVTSDGTHLFVTDLGFNRVLIWNSIPTANTAPADVAIGQPDLVSAIPNNAFSGTAATTATDTNKETPVLCTTPTGTLDSANNPEFPSSCNATLDFPRYALAGGGRLFIADGGNDRVLIFNQIPTASGASADTVIGQLGGGVNQASDASDSLSTPLGLAWDGSNLYVSDAFHRRITVYTIGANAVPYQGVRNAASFAISASGNVTISGTINAGEKVTITVNSTDYTYTVVTGDTLNTVVTALVTKINASNNNAGDPNVLATADLSTNQVVLTAKQPGTAGNSITYAATTTAAAGSGTTQIVASAASSSLLGGGDAASIAPGTIVSIVGTNLSAGTAAADLSQTQLPTNLGGTEVYFNGIPAPLYFVSPAQVNAQIPWEVLDTTSINAFVRSVMSDGTVMTTTPVAVTIVAANPGIFAQAGSQPAGTPQTAVAFHGSSFANGIVDVEGAIQAGDIAVVGVADRTYTYTVLATDTLLSIRDALVALINQDPQVTAAPSGVFPRIVIQARIQGPEGNGIALTATQQGTGPALVMTAFTPSLCCANVGGSLVTADNPAVPGEFIILYATGLGVPNLTSDLQPLIQTGVQFPVGGPVTTPGSSVSSLAGGLTADVISATLLPGTVGTFQVVLHLNPDVTPVNGFVNLNISQDLFTSNTVAVPVAAGQ